MNTEQESTLLDNIGRIADALENLVDVMMEK